MALITWDEKYSVGIKSIDLQHQKLIDLINQLNSMMMEGKGEAATVAVIDELIEYTKTHFSTEEHYFQQTFYPDYLEHKKKHDEFIAKVDAFQQDHENGKTISVVLGISKLLWDWLSQHILVVDKKYTDHLKRKGIN